MMMDERALVDTRALLSHFDEFRHGTFKATQFDGILNNKTQLSSHEVNCIQKYSTKINNFLSIQSNVPNIQAKCISRIGATIQSTVNSSWPTKPY